MCARVMFCNSVKGRCLYLSHVLCLTTIYPRFVFSLPRFEAEQQELEKRRKKAIEEYHQKKSSSSSSSLDNSGQLPTSQNSSMDSHDISLTTSPSQSRRVPVVDLENYQEAGKIGSVSLTSSSGHELPSLPSLKRDPAADMEKKVKSELMAEWGEGPSNQTHNQQERDMALSTRNFSSPPGIRSPRHLTNVQDLHAKTPHMHGSSKAYVQQHHRGAEGSPLSPPLPRSNQSPVPRSPTLPAATFTLPTSPPPVSQQSIWTSRLHSQQLHHCHLTQPRHYVSYQHHHNAIDASSAGTTTGGVQHLDSGEWTEFASAPYGLGQDSTPPLPSTVLPSCSTFSEGFSTSLSTPALGTLTSSGSGGLLVGQQKVETDVSEFDPIAVSSSGDAELYYHHSQPSSKQGT